MTEFAAHFDVLKKYIKFLKMCFSVNQIDIYRAVIKSSPGPSVFRGKTTNYLFKFFTDTSFNSDKHYQLPALLA